MDEDAAQSLTDTLKALSGEDLTLHSIEALHERIAVLSAEMTRTQAMIENKKSSRADAEAFFKS